MKKESTSDIRPAVRFAKRMLPIRLPELSELGRECRVSLAVMEQSYLDCSPMVGRNIRNWLSKDPANTRDYGCLTRERLIHELSPFAMERRYARDYQARTKEELSVFSFLLSRNLASLLNEGLQRFEDLLCEISIADSGPESFRTHIVSNGVDLAGGTLVYPRCEQIRPQLSKLYDFLRKYGTCRPTYAAIVAYVGICNIHPFADGNGRLARLLYNWIILSAFPHAFYLPIYEISALSDAGLLIRQRQAELHGQWGPLVEFFSSVVTEMAERYSS